MKKNLLELYAFMVCGCMVLALLVAAGNGGMALVSIWQPELVMEDSRFQTDDTYWRSIRQDNEARPAKEVLTQQKETEFQAAIAEEHHSGLRTLIYASIFAVFAAIAFALHWRIARWAAKSDPTTNDKGVSRSSRTPDHLPSP